MSYINNPESLVPLLGSLLDGSTKTLMIFFLTIIFSLPLGFLCSLCSISKVSVVRRITNLYILLMRGTPLMLQLMFFYYGLNIAGINIDRFPSAILSMILNYTAYYSEIFRGGIQSIERGQHEAADVLGFSKAQTMRKIVLPQVIKRVMPSIGNEIITLVKDTALVTAIAVPDLLKMAESAVMRTSDMTPFIVAALFYLIMITVVTRILKLIEDKLAYYR
ncbi:MAG: amino acid ABC transporter permease [Christensenellales bacterium]|jgi:polar amino acid transport system permease protein